MLLNFKHSGEAGFLNSPKNDDHDQDYWTAMSIIYCDLV